LDTIILASPNQYGYFTIYYNYAKYLSKEYKVIYICFDQGDTKFEPSENVRVVYVPLSNKKTYNILRYYREIIRTYNSRLPAKLILKYYFFSSFLNLFIPRKSLILDIRTGYISKTRIKTFFYNQIIRIEALAFKRVIVLSESLRKRLKLRNHKTTIVPLGANPETFSAKEFVKLKLLYVGTLTSRNIYQTVEGLFKYIKQNNNNLDITYHIVGGGKPAEVNKLKNTISHLNLQDIVHYEGQIYGDRLRIFFMNSNIGVSYIPMLDDYDCQPATKTIEYLMAGMPVIATETFENKSIISDYNGVLTKDDPQSFADGLKKIVSVKLKYDCKKISSSVNDYSFECIIDNKLKPLLYSE
jgi:glycosyltransferase involved in cell wall biosynthesis